MLKLTYETRINNRGKQYLLTKKLKIITIYFLHNTKLVNYSVKISIKFCIIVSYKRQPCYILDRILPENKLGFSYKAIRPCWPKYFAQ